MQKAQQYLRFGQIIRLHGHKYLQDDNVDINASNIPQSVYDIRSRSDFGSPKISNKLRGMIAVKGFTDKDAKYLTFKHLKRCQFYRQTLFQILPRGQFQKQDNEEKKKQLYQQLCKQKMGEFVKFGQDVVFRHVDSLDYLSGSVRCSDGGLGAFKVQLSDQLLINLVFKLYPFRSFQKQGDKIKLQSPLRIKNISNRCYISIQKNEIKQKKITKYYIVTTYSQDFTWLIHLHQSHETLDDIDQIRTHDIMYLAHTKNDGYLCIDNQKGNKIGGCIKLPLYNTGYHCFTCLWEVEKFALPKISPYQQSDKNHLGTQGTYSLKQLLTGRYLQVSEQKKQYNGLNINSPNNQRIDPYEITIKSAKGLPNVSDYLKHLGLVKIGGPKIQGDGQIDAGDQVVLESEKKNLKYRQSSPYQINQMRLSKAESVHGFRIIKIDQQSKRQVLFILSTYQVLDQFLIQLKKQNIGLRSKQIQIIDFTLQKLIAFIKNCTLKDIQLDVLPIKKRQFICKDVQICVKLFSILQVMGEWILKQVYKASKVQNQAFKTTFNRAYYLIWQIIRNNPITKLYVCQTWLNIILDHAIQNQQQTVHQTLNQILQSNQLVVTKFLKQNNNKLVQKIIDIFTLKPPHEKFLNIFRASCTSNGAPIVANQKLILNIFFKQLQQVSKFKFYGVVDNFSQNQRKLKKIQIYCYISKDHGHRRSLKQFFQDSSRLDLSQTSNYFIAYLNLLADICFGRNTQAKKYVQEILVPQIFVGFGQRQSEEITFSSLDTLIGILEDEEMKSVKGANNLFRAVVRLINYAYVVSADQNPVLRINRYRNLDNMKKQAVEVGPKFKKVMKFIIDKLKSFQSFFSIQKNDNDLDKKQKQLISLQQKMLMLTVLQLLKSTLIIGYWTVQQQQNQLVPLLLQILKNEKKYILHSKQNLDIDSQKRQFQTFKKQVSQLTPSVQLIVMCKALACQLIETIFDFRHDNLVTKCVQFYKLKSTVRRRSLLQQKGGQMQLNLAQLQSNIQVHPLYDPILWTHQLQQIFSDSKSNSQVDKVSQTNKLMNPLMVQLSIHKNPVLFFRSLKIMKRHFQYRSDILKLFLSLSIYDNTNGVQLANQIIAKRRLLGKLEEENLLYSNQENVYDQIMTFLVWLSQSIKEGTNLARIPRFQDYMNIFHHFNQQSRINKFHQRLIKNKDIHPVLCNFIGLSKQPIAEFKGQAKTVLKYVYRFLALLSKSFNQAKLQIIHMQQRIFNHIQQQCQNITRLLQDFKKNRISSNSQTAYYYHISTSLGRQQFSRNDILSLQSRDDCQAIQLLIQLFNQNKNIIYNQTMMQQISIQVSQMINTVPIQTYYKSHLLDFFRTMLYYKDKHIVVNQSRILAKLQDSKKKHIYYRSDNIEEVAVKGLSPENLDRLVEEWKYMNKQLLQIIQPESPYPLHKNQQKPVIILPQLTYYITLTNLFANLVQGQHIVNIGKCRQVHSYSQLMRIMKTSDICYPLKTHLRNYINQLYYSTKIQQDLCLQIIKQQLPLIIQDLNNIIVILSKQRQGKFCIVHPVRYKYFDTYIYLYIEQIVYSLNYLQEDENFIRQLGKQLNNNYYTRGYFYLHYFVIRIYQRLRWLLNFYYQHKYLRGFLNKVTNKMKKTFLMEFKQTMYRVFDRNQQKMHQPIKKEDIKINQQTKPKAEINQTRVKALQKRSKHLMGKLMKGQIGNYFKVNRHQKQRNFPLTFFLPYGDQTQNSQENIQINNRQDQLRKIAEKLKVMLFSKQRQKDKVKKDYHHRKLTQLQIQLMKNINFKQFMLSFKTLQCNQLYQVDKFSFDYHKFQSKFVSFEQYIKIFVKVNTQQPDSISNDLKIFFFQVLLQFIVRHCKRQKSIQQWKDQDWQQSRKQIVEAQTFLYEANVAELIIESLKNTDDINLSSYVLLFGIGYLIGGNTNCQNSLLFKLRDDVKNDVFIKIQKLISRLGKKIASRISQKTNNQPAPLDQFIVQSLDLYDYYDDKVKAMKRSINEQKISKQQMDEQQIQKVLFSRLFKFLQLLCECNNFQLKHFIRVQSNSDGNKKNYSFNLINMTTFEIRRIFKVMSQQASKVILPLMDFLNQVVTVPCIQNQISLCQTTFFQDLCYMASSLIQDKILRERGFDTEESKQRLLNIYHKCILIILNVLEGNYQQLTKELLIKLDAAFLLRIIQKNLEALTVFDKKDLHECLYNINNQTEKVPVALENAINVMIVLEKLQASQESEKFIMKKKAFLNQSMNKQNNLEKVDNVGNNVNVNNKKVKRRVNLTQLLKALRQQMLKIQVNSSRGKQFIYFPKHPILTKLSQSTKDRIMTQVSRSTQRQKIKSLFSFKQQINTQIQHNFKIQKQRFLFGLISFQPSSIAKLQQYSFYTSYLTLILWFLTTDIIVEYNQVIYFEPYFIRPILMGLNIIQLMITFAYFLSYYKCKFELAKFRAKKYEEAVKKEQEKEKRNRVQNGVMMDEEINQQINSQNNMINAEDISNNIIRRNNKSSLSKFSFSSLLHTIITLITSLITQSSLFIITKFDQKFKYVLLYLITSLFGTFYSQSAFLIYIVYFFLQNQTLSNVFNAIFYNLNQLFSVGLLGVVFVYIFSLICYQTYALDIMSQKDTDQACDSIVGCIMDLYVSGTIGGTVEEFQFVRFMTDLIYFIFFGLLFGNIVSGIMIDTFAQLRSKREEMNDDKKNRCYICGKDRAALQKTNQNFDIHIKQNHYLWNYIYYMYCLNTKPKTQFSGLEYEIKQCIDSGENQEKYISWIPFNTESEDANGEKIQEIKNMVIGLHNDAIEKIQMLQLVPNTTNAQNQLTE